MISNASRMIFSERKAEITFIVILATLSFALRIFHLDFQSLWNDELATWYFAKLPLAEILKQLRDSEAHPPLYFAFMHFWVACFGDSEWSLRFPSAIFGSVAVVYFYFLAKTFWDKDRKVAVLGSLFFCFSTTSILYSQEARAYSLLLLCSVAAVFHTSQWTNNRVARQAIFACIWLTIGLYTHYFMGFVFLLLVAFGNLRKVAVAVAVLYLPWIFVFLYQLQTRKLPWLQGITLSDQIQNFAQFIFYSPAEFYPLQVGPWLVTAAMAILILGVGLVYCPKNWIFLSMWLLFPLALCLGISNLWQPILWERYLVISLPPAFLLLAASIKEIRTFTWAKTMLAAVFLFMQIYYLFAINKTYSMPHKEEWRKTTTRINVQKIPVATCAWRKEYFSYYGISPLANFCSISDKGAISVANIASPFWYLYGHRTPDPSLMVELQKNFTIVDQVKALGVGAFLFLPKAWSGTSVR